MGAGNGLNLRAFRELGYPAVYGADVSWSLLKDAPRGSSVCSDAYCLSFKDTCADAVFLSDILHHLDVPKLFREIRRVLKPGGKVHLIEPYPTIWRRIADFLTFYGLPWISKTFYYRRVILTYEMAMYQPWLSGCDRVLSEEIAASDWSVVSRRISLFDIHLTLEKPQALSRSDPGLPAGRGPH